MHKLAGGYLGDYKRKQETPDEDERGRLKRHESGYVILITQTNKGIPYMFIGQQEIIIVSELYWNKPLL